MSSVGRTRLRVRHGAAGRLLPAALLLAALGACGGGGAPPDIAAPVRVATVVQGIVPAEITGIGNVTPITSVAVKSRVDGQIVEVPVREGSDVKRGALLFRIDPRPFEVQLEIAAANLARDQALLAKAEDLLKRSDDLIAKGYISANQYSDAQGDARAAAAGVVADRAAVASARLNLGFTELRSPIDGRVGRVALQQGNLVKANDTTALLTVNQLDPIYVDFSVPERYLSDLRRAAQGGDVQVALTTDGASGNPVVRAGPLTFVDNQVDQPTGTVRLRATVANADRALWPGQFARVTIAVPTAGPALWVPASAVGQSPEGPYVFVVGANLKAEQRHITVERTEGERAVLSGAISVGERVVVDGQSRVLPGSAVTLITDAAEPPRVAAAPTVGPPPR
jgi:membrane fusion protein, multidrug efflux system